MLEGAFIVHLDDYHGFIVEKRFPATLVLNEKVLNLIYYDHLKEKQQTIKFSELEKLRIISYMDDLHPGWMICFTIDSNTTPESTYDIVTGMSRLLLELITSNPDMVDLEEIIQKRSILPEPSEEQKIAEVFLTPSSALILERMQLQTIESAAKLSIWLKNEIQSDTVDIREAVTPLIQTGMVKVEVIGKTRETVFLIKDIFSYRAPPVESIAKAKELYPNILSSYLEAVKTFFSPPPPEKGYNPTLKVDDPNSPIVEDREKIARILAHRLHYLVLQCLRNQPLGIEEIVEKISLPKGVVQNSLWVLEADRIAMCLEESNLWALITNPVIETFLPEYALPIISRKLVDKEIVPETASRYLELLAGTWSES
ncbi:MAG: hypothetical protein ACFFEF_10720 [Candidatus Thorarchaeota archaeon]